MKKLALICLFVSTLSNAQTAPVSAPASPSQDRLVVSGDEIYDKKTDKTWKRCNYGQTWDNSNGWCRGVAKRLTVAIAATEVGELNGGWRVAELGEVLSVLEIACAAIVGKSDPVFAEIHHYDWYLTATRHGNPDSIMGARCQGVRTDTAGLGSKYVSLIRIVRDGR
jgi:hypothetical protein